jgi:FKBP-type peptidyl-prolyl cis-trans isomerase FkpA
MKRLQILGLMVLAIIAFVSCKNLTYQTTKSGMKYKIIDGGSKDSTKDGYVLKMNMVQKLTGHKDSLLKSTYGRVPFFAQIRPITPETYGPEELFHKLKKGDSLITIMSVDSLFKKNPGMETQVSFLKKGDKITATFKVIEVYKADSLARLDFQKEMEKDAPLQEKEREEQMNKMKADQEAQQKTDDAAIEKSGEKLKQQQFVEKYIADKKLSATKTALGDYVKIDNPGTGAPAVDGKFVTIKYSGKKMTNDSTFESNSFTYQVGKQGMIRGFEDGIKQFKQGGKGTVYIPGYLAYGKQHPPVFKDYEPLAFDIEVTNVSDSMPAQKPMPPMPHPQKPPTPKAKK